MISVMENLDFFADISTQGTRNVLLAEGGGFICHICGKIFESVTGRNKHRNKHPPDNNSDTNNNPDTGGSRPDEASDTSSTVIPVDQPQAGPGLDHDPAINIQPELPEDRPRLEAVGTGPGGQERQDCVVSASISDHNTQSLPDMAETEDISMSDLTNSASILGTKTASAMGTKSASSTQAKSSSASRRMTAFTPGNNQQKNLIIRDQDNISQSMASAAMTSMSPVVSMAMSGPPGLPTLAPAPQMHPGPQIHMQPGPPASIAQPQPQMTMQPGPGAMGQPGQPQTMGQVRVMVRV